MKKEIADRWVAALRSGKYKQGQYHLNDGNGNYCCLGVLCELAKEDGIVTSSKFKLFDGPEVILYKDKTNSESVSFLPAQVSYWAGIETSAAYSTKNRASLAALNDAGQTFEYIANVIEDEWETM